MHTKNEHSPEILNEYLSLKESVEILEEICLEESDEESDSPYYGELTKVREELLRFMNVNNISETDYLGTTYFDILKQEAIDEEMDDYFSENNEE